MRTITTTGGRRTGKPSFFWQGLLILLPVVALAGVGLYSLRLDKAVARLAAAEHAQAIADLLVDKIWNALTTAPWPGESDPDSFQVDGAGRLVFPPPYEISPVPRPFPWADLSREQARLWLLAIGLGATETDDQTAADRWRVFLQLLPPADFAASARFRLALLLARQQQSSAAVEQFRTVTEDYPQAMGESGLPLRPLAQMKLLTLAVSDPARTPSEKAALFSSVCSNAVAYPTAVTSHLLLLAAELESDFNSTPKICRRWMETWARHESARKLYAAAEPHLILASPAEGVAPSRSLPRLFWFAAHPPDGETNNPVRLDQTWLARRIDGGATNVWFGCRSLDEDFRKPRRSAQTTPAPPNPAANSASTPAPAARLRILVGRNVPNPRNQVGLAFREGHNTWSDLSVIEHASRPFSAADLLDSASIKLPDYFDITLDVAGKALVASNQLPTLVYADGGKGSGRYWKRTTANTPPPLLAQARKVVDGVEWVRVGVHLIGPDRLYARERDRAFWFGALIAVSTLAAVLGFASAWRAFVRQQRLSEMKSNFVSSVSHELRAPIASVRLMAEGLERGTVQERGRQHEYFRFIVQECRRLSALIENVLDFSRIEQGRKQYEFEPTDLPALVRETARLLEPNAAEKALALALEISDAPPSFANSTPRLDGRAIQQALVNLIDNALKHSPAGSTVTIGLDWPQVEVPDGPHAASASGTGEEPARVRLWVEDRGEGIPAAEHERIFERFYRRGSELRRETQGVGIGLSLVQHIVQAHGGRVIVRSAMGQGSRFTLELPVLQEHGA